MDYEDINEQGNSVDEKFRKIEINVSKNPQGLLIYNFFIPVWYELIDSVVFLK